MIERRDPSLLEFGADVNGQPGYGGRRCAKDGGVDVAAGVKDAAAGPRDSEL